MGFIIAPKIFCIALQVLTQLLFLTLAINILIFILFINNY